MPSKSSLSLALFMTVYNRDLPLECHRLMSAEYLIQTNFIWALQAAQTNAESNKRRSCEQSGAVWVEGKSFAPNLYAEIA